YVVRDGEMMNQRQRHHDVSGPALEKRRALAVRPAERWRWVGEIEHERQNSALAARTKCAIVLLDGTGIDVEGDDGRAGLPRDTAVDAGVRAEIPNHRRTQL